MDKLPNELFGEIVSKFHDEFCGCTSETSRPPARELCSLRLVNKGFFLAATRLLHSHGTLVFHFDWVEHADIFRKFEYCSNAKDLSTVSQITGLRIDLLTYVKGAEHSRPLRYHIEQPQYQSPLSTRQLAKANNAWHACLDRFSTLVVPLRSVTALGLRMNEAVLQPRAPCENISPFIHNNLPNLTDLYIRSPKYFARAILDNMSPEQRSKLRSLSFYLTYISDLPVQSPDAAQLPNLRKLALHGDCSWPLMNQSYILTTVA